MSAPPIPAKSSAFDDPDHWHPLEMFPFFRRWPCGPIRDVFYTFIWNCFIAFMFMAVGLLFKSRWPTWEDLLSMIIVANSIGYVLHAIFLITNGLGLDRWARGRGQLFAAVYYTGLSTFGVVVGFAIVALAFDPHALGWILRPRSLIAMAITSAILSTIIAALFFGRERQARATADLERERLRAERVEREAAVANLRALQAQIEPHFLFNTLANVASLIDPDPATAKRMLDSFIRFLRASLTATRSERTTLGAEAELITAFLQVLQVRMGARLRFRIELAPELAAFELPPMLLQPVVENAIRHGLEPKVEGGELVVRMRLAGKDAVLEIADTGVGFQPTTRGGVGLSNLRDRLRLLYGERASLTIGENQPAGAAVTLRLPG